MLKVEQSLKKDEEISAEHFDIMQFYNDKISNKQLHGFFFLE